MQKKQKRPEQIAVQQAMLNPGVLDIYIDVGWSVYAFAAKNYFVKSEFFSAYNLRHHISSLNKLLVGMTGLEPAASWSLTTRATTCATSRYAASLRHSLRNISYYKILVYASMHVRIS